jgi:hypothetical protein
MGAKAKQAINQAEAAIGEILGATDRLLANLKELDKVRGACFEKQMVLAKYLTDNKGSDDMVARAKADPNITQMLRNIEDARQEIARVKGECSRDHDGIIAGDQSLMAAVDVVANLIKAKQAKRDKKTSNPLKKLVNIAKTKSLGDLRAEFDRILKAHQEVKNKTMGIKISDYR